MKKHLATLRYGLALAVLWLMGWSVSGMAGIAIAKDEDFAGRLAVSAPEDAWVNVEVKFKVNSAQIQPSSFATLNDLAQDLNKPSLQGYRFLIEGHTDMSGTWEVNASLSARRAQAVRDYLAGRGVQASRLQAVGAAYQQLLPNLPMNDPAHRRVVVRRL